MKTVQEKSCRRKYTHGLEKDQGFSFQWVTTITLRVAFTLALLSVFSHSGALAASFDCAKARTQIEKIICANQSLSELDDAVHKAYFEAKKVGDADTITSRQRAWLKERNACATTECIQQLYTRRLNELNGKQEISPVLRRISRPQNLTVMQKTVSAKEILETGAREYPPYPDIWGVELPRSSVGNVSIWGIYQAANGDIVFGASWYPSKSDFDWLIADNKYVMTGLFSGKQWRISQRDAFLEKNRGENGWLTLYKEIPCPIPLPADDPDGRDRCHARIDHRFPNGNRLLYVDTYNSFPYCYIEHYFSYLALVAPDGRVLRQVTPIVVSKTKEKRDGLGGDPPCEDLPGGKTYKEINTWTQSPVIKLFMPLADGSFLLVLRPKYGFKQYLIRFDQNFTSPHPAFGKEIFMMDTKTLEKMGNIYSDPKRTIQDNALRTDRKIYEYLTGKNKERR